MNSTQATLVTVALVVMALNGMVRVWIAYGHYREYRESNHDSAEVKQIISTGMTGIIDIGKNIDRDMAKVTEDFLARDAGPNLFGGKN